MSIDITNTKYSDVVQIAQQLNRAVVIKRYGGSVVLKVE